MKLEVKNVYSGYGKRQILKDISFKVDTGEILCILGPNGSGKTTLFKSILGFLNLQKGEILYEGQNISNWSRQKLAKTIAYIPQAHVSSFNYSVRDIVLMGRTAHLKQFDSPSKKDEVIALESLKSLNILHLKDKAYTEISGGERQLVLIARAIAQQSKILIMDEPTSNLDFGNQILVLKEVKDLAAKGYTIIMSSHNPEYIYLLASKVLLMKKGGVIKIGKPIEVMTEGGLEKIYGIPVRIVDAFLSQNKIAKVFLPANY
jgi:iron complex transport system ATP-binding protein